MNILPSTYSQNSFIMEDTRIPLTSYEQDLIDSYHMEQRKQQLEPLKVDLIDFRNHNHTGYIINESSEYQDDNSMLRSLFCILIIAAILGICYYYWPLLDGLFREGVK